jgi:hypothetical protein
MHKQILTTIAVLPLLLNLSQAAQRWTIESSQPYGIPQRRFWRQRVSRRRHCGYHF